MNLLVHISNKIILVIFIKHFALCYCRYPVVAMGVLRWLEHLALEPSFFKVASDSYIVYLILLDEVMLLGRGGAHCV